MTFSFDEEDPRVCGNVAANLGRIQAAIDMPPRRICGKATTTDIVARLGIINASWWIEAERRRATIKR